MLVRLGNYVQAVVDEVSKSKEANMNAAARVDCATGCDIAGGVCTAACSWWFPLCIPACAIALAICHAAC